MKDFGAPIAAILLAAAAGAGAAAAAPDKKGDRTLTALDVILAQVAASQKEHDRNPSKIPLGEGDWKSLFDVTCTADTASGNPSLTDEAGCAAATDSNGGGCAWCDATEAMGSGICVSLNQKDALSFIWDTVCADSGSDGGTPVDPPASPDAAKVDTSPPTPPPTPAPTEPAVAPAVDCMTVQDEATCSSSKDDQSMSGENCEWCDVYFVGGTCMSASMKSSISLVCKNGGGAGLRGGRGDVDAW